MTMTYKSNVASSIDSLVAAVKTSKKTALQKAAVNKPVLMSFDEVETNSVPTNSSLTVVVSGPLVQEDMDNGEMSTFLENQARIMSQDILKDVLTGVKEVLR